MIKHTVCFKLTDRSREKCEKTREVLMGMKGRVPQVEKIDVNIDQLRSGRSYDVMLEVYVADWSALEEYQKDAYHCDVVKKYMHANTETSVAMDFEV